MQAVIVMILFLVHGVPIGAKLVGSAPTVQGCEQAAAKVIADHEGQEPTDALGDKSTPFPVCIDTTPMSEEAKSAEHAKQSVTL